MPATSQDPNVSAKFNPYRARYPVRLPTFKRPPHPDELERVTTNQGLGFLQQAPDDAATLSTRTGERGRPDRTRYLWVVMGTALPVCLETPAPGLDLSQERVCHTNLTGGAEAHCAGEMWFYDHESVILTGASSRYKPRSVAELSDVAASFQACGYRVANLGWSAEVKEFVRVLRGDPQWL